MKKTRRIFALLLTLAMSLSLLTGCGGGDDASTDEGGGETSGSNELTVYTAFPEAEVAYYFNAFEEATGIHVNSLRLSAGEMLTRVAAEKDNPQASLMFGGSTDNYIAASNQGLLEAYQSPELSNTPENYLDPDGVWNPIYVGAIAFACNKDWFADKGYDYPTSWDDLLDPKYQDMIIMAHPATSGTAYTVLATLIQLKGEDAVWDYLAELNKNMSQYTKSGSAAPNGVALFPSQLVSSGLDFLHFFLLCFLARRNDRPGRIGAFYLLFYSIGRFCIEFFRGDLERGQVGGLSTSQFISLFTAAAGLVFLILLSRKKEPGQPASEGEK